MKVLPLSLEEMAKFGFTHKVNIKFTDLTAAATTQTLQLLPEGMNLAAGWYIARWGHRIRTNFNSASVTALTMSVGDSGSGTRFINANSVFTGQTPISHSVGSTAYVYTAADYIRVLFTATTANLSALTAGEVDIYLHLAAMPDLDRD